MKLLITTIAAVLLVGCGPSVPDDSIHIAAHSGDIEAVKQHIAAGTDLSAKSGPFRESPLHHAAREGHKEIAKLLIAAGADVNVKNYQDETALNYTIPWQHTEIADLLRKHGGKTAEELKAEGK
jgi:ankyrin repeat protein